jgi:hypothetical protein
MLSSVLELLIIFVLGFTVKVCVWGCKSYDLIRTKVQMLSTLLSKSSTHTD